MVRSAVAGALAESDGLCVGWELGFCADAEPDVAMISATRHCKERRDVMRRTG